MKLCVPLEEIGEVHVVLEAEQNFEQADAQVVEQGCSAVVYNAPMALVWSSQAVQRRNHSKGTWTVGRPGWGQQLASLSRTASNWRMVVGIGLLQTCSMQGQAEVVL